ncbi:MAG: indole-3-glycerol phosphate synthase TrpC [Veillonellaceae bacterium]|jgi:indole-3-glycerol phosphate synthase|nr:indole-3-glycerol phosphate synthase TrpC [Veillonellaceae bacterium]
MLDKIVRRKKAEVECQKITNPLAVMRCQIERGEFAFSNGLSHDWNLIAECKLSSPVKGRLSQSYSVVELAEIYIANGAAAISVHTDRHFCGKLGDIKAVKQVSSLPVLRKDFIIDEYQIYQALHAGADAILLIAAILSSYQLEKYIDIASGLGLDALVEVHNLEELKIVHKTSARLIGINNRDLRTFKTNIENTFSLAQYFNPAKIYISESGIKSEADAIRLKNSGVRGVLVGEGLVTEDDVAAKTREISLLNSNGGNSNA